MPYVQFNFKIPSELASKLPSLKHMRKCTKTSEYIRELIQLDLAGRVSKAESTDSPIDMKDISRQIETTSVNAKNEILQRLLILTKLTIELLGRTLGNQLKAEQIQTLVNGFIEEATKRYPLNK